MFKMSQILVKNNACDKLTIPTIKKHLVFNGFNT